MQEMDLTIIQKMMMTSALADMNITTTITMTALADMNTIITMMKIALVDMSIN